MKGDTKSIVRVENLINNDRIKTNDGFLDLLIVDLNKVMSDYFDYKGYPAVEMEKAGGSFVVSVNLSVSGIKGFKRLPDETAI